MIVRLTQSRFHHQPRTMRLLLVNDNFDHLSLVIDRIKKVDAKIAILTAMNASDAIALLAKYRDEISAIVSDLNMPVERSFDLVKAIRRIGFTTPFFILTASDDVSEKEALKAGVTGVFYKPVTIATVIAAIRKELSTDS